VPRAERKKTKILTHHLMKRKGTLLILLKQFRKIVTCRHKNEIIKIIILKPKTVQ